MIGKELEEFIKDETKAFEERLRAKAEELQEQIPSKHKTIWDLDIVDKEGYYRLYGDGRICHLSFNGYMDAHYRKAGGAFLTLEEAEFEAERREIGAIMRKYSKPFEYEEENWYIGYSHKVGKIVIEAHYTLVDRNPHFETKEIAQKVIEEIGKDRLKKYWFGVRDE